MHNYHMQKIATDTHAKCHVICISKNAQ